MNKSNFEQSLHAIVRRRPFKPFTVELMSGDRFVIDHPEALALRGAIAVYINPKGKYTLFDNSGVSQLTEATERRSAAS